jgi:hypothetical protein
MQNDIEIEIQNYVVIFSPGWSFKNLQNSHTTSSHTIVSTGWDSNLWYTMYLKKNTRVSVIHIYSLLNHEIGTFHKFSAKSPSFSDMNVRGGSTAP